MNFGGPLLEIRVEIRWVTREIRVEIRWDTRVQYRAQSHIRISILPCARGLGPQVVKGVLALPGGPSGPPRPPRPPRPLTSIR